MFLNRISKCQKETLLYFNTGKTMPLYRRKTKQPQTGNTIYKYMKEQPQTYYFPIR